MVVYCESNTEQVNKLCGEKEELFFRQLCVYLCVCVCVFVCVYTYIHVYTILVGPVAQSV